MHKVQKYIQFNLLRHAYTIQSLELRIVFSYHHEQLINVTYGSPLLDWEQPVFASSCSLELGAPSLVSIFSHPLTAATAGEQLVIATTIRTCLEEEQPFVAIIEVRNSDAITEYLGWQSGILKEKDDSTQIGLSWVPRHGGIPLFSM